MRNRWFCGLSVLKKNIVSKSKLSQSREINWLELFAVQIVNYRTAEERKKRMFPSGDFFKHSLFWVSPYLPKWQI